MEIKDTRIAIIGLGYVGLPLAITFAEKFPVVGFDINSERIKELSVGIDRTKEVDKSDLLAVSSLTNPYFNSYFQGLFCTSDITDIAGANVFIITVPTPIDSYNVPNLTPLIKASREVSKLLKKGDLVIYESTVYPGCTEEECVPVLEKYSGLKLNIDFTVGYSPERINPGDKVNTLTTIKKVTSGSNDFAAEFVDSLYKTIISAGTHKASSIKVAEASKAIENAQRDVNISFVNELALIFDRLGIDTQDVLEAAGTKYNFLPFKPGLVGGHCISVDPFYLAHKAAQVGYQPHVILSGRRVNDQMAHFVASKVVKLMTAKDIPVKGSKALILGITFKENCPDVRNSKVVDIYKELKDYGVNVDVYDPWADVEQVSEQYNIQLLNTNLAIKSKKEVYESIGCYDEVHNDINISQYDAIILAVGHLEFKDLDFSKIKKEKSVIFDTKGVLERTLVDARL